ncbi:MAG: RNA methyltransferase [Vicinamibacterales bacterium]
MRTRITSRQHPVVRRVRALASGRVRDACLLDGAHLLYEALDAGLSFELVAVAPRAIAREGRALEEALRLSASTGVPAFELPDEVADGLTSRGQTSGVFAVAAPPRFDLERALAPPDTWVVVACDVQEPGNVGAIVRVAAAAGATAVVTTGASADVWSWKALRGSMGSTLRLPTTKIGDWPETLTLCRHHGLRVVLADPRGPTPMDDARFAGRLALWVGGEGRGFPPALLAAADDTVRIPMDARVTSLNVATATAVLAFEIRRQRRAPRV